MSTMCRARTDHDGSSWLCDLFADHLGWHLSVSSKDGSHHSWGDERWDLAEPEQMLHEGLV